LLGYDIVLENVLGVLESPGKVLEFFVSERVGILYLEIVFFFPVLKEFKK